MKNSIQPIARLAGILYLLLIPLGILGIIYVPSTILVPGDIATTVSNIVANEALFRLSIVSALLVQVVNIFVVLFLYKLLKPVSKVWGIFMVVFILVAVPIAMVNELNHVAVLALVTAAEQSPALISLFIGLHDYGIYIAGIFWGLWLFPMGYLVYKSGFLPKLIGILLMIGCFGYLADSFLYLLAIDVGFEFSSFLFIGEVVLPLWLVIKGVNEKKWNAVSKADNAAPQF